MTQPRVAINARAAARTQIGGVERFAREMAARLPALAPQRYRVLAPPRALAHRAGHAWEQGVLPLQASGCELLYSPANLAPILCGRNVVVIHDAAPWRHPEAYSPAYVAYQRRILPRIARSARMLLTVSEFSRGELVEVLGAAVGRIRVIAPGVDARLRPDADPSAARERHGLSRPYVLALGTASARKNLGVLDATERALRAHGIDLVLAGSERAYMRSPTVPARRIGYVSEEHLPGLYAGARALAMPSLYEGFGLPCLEAMASGTPVVIAACAALPETCGDSALHADPGDPEEFAGAVLAAAREEGLRSRLVASGLARAACFPWSRTAEETDRALAELLAGQAA